MEQCMDHWTEKITQAASAVFRSMIGGRLEQLDRQLEPSQSGLTAIIGLTGQPAGILTVSTELSAASRIAEKMLGCETVGSEEYARDALGEICNMVAGNLKSALPAPVDRCEISVPTVISGTNYKIKPMLYGNRHSVAFSFEGESIVITLQVEP